MSDPLPLPEHLKSHHIFSGKPYGIVTAQNPAAHSLPGGNQALEARMNGEGQGQFSEPAHSYDHTGGWKEKGHRYSANSGLIQADKSFWQSLGRAVGLNKNLPMAPIVAPALHSTVEGFMGGLKSLPKGSPARGKLITQHMNHPAFLSALQVHPQGKQIHSMLTQHLNSQANAGWQPGKAVAMVKALDPHVNSQVTSDALQEHGFKPDPSAGRKKIDWPHAAYRPGDNLIGNGRPDTQLNAMADADSVNVEQAGGVTSESYKNPEPAVYHAPFGGWHEEDPSGRRAPHKEAIEADKSFWESLGRAVGLGAIKT